jgi:hypothetical protein
VRISRQLDGQAIDFLICFLPLDIHCIAMYHVAMIIKKEGETGMVKHHELRSPVHSVLTGLRKEQYV